MRSLVVMLGVVWLAACSSSTRLAWRRADGSYDPKQLQVDVDACEQHAKTVANRRRGPSTAGARPYGGWGDPDFEFCMHQKEWKLTSVRGDEPRPAESPPK